MFFKMQTGLDLLAIISEYREIFILAQHNHSWIIQHTSIIPVVSVTLYLLFRTKLLSFLLPPDLILFLFSVIYKQAQNVWLISSFVLTLMLNSMSTVLLVDNLCHSVNIFYKTTFYCINFLFPLYKIFFPFHTLIIVLSGELLESFNLSGKMRSRILFVFTLWRIDIAFHPFMVDKTNNS